MTAQPSADSSGSRPSRQRRGRGSLSREEILEAALTVVREEGVEKLSMRRIADRLQCSVASPYAYFAGGMEDIVRELIILGERDLTARLRRARDSSQNVFDQLDAIARTYWSFSTENRELHKLMFNMDAGQMYRTAFSSLPTSYRVFLETIRQGISAGQIQVHRRRYPAVARTMWAWMYGLIILEMGDMLRSRKTTIDPIQEGIDLFKEMLKSSG